MFSSTLATEGRVQHKNAHGTRVRSAIVNTTRTTAIRSLTPAGPADAIKTTRNNVITENSDSSIPPSSPAPRTNTGHHVNRRFFSSSNNNNNNNVRRIIIMMLIIIIIIVVVFVVVVIKTRSRPYNRAQHHRSIREIYVFSSSTSLQQPSFMVRVPKVSVNELILLHEYVAI